MEIKFEFDFSSNPSFNWKAASYRHLVGRGVFVVVLFFSTCVGATASSLLLCAVVQGETL